MSRSLLASALALVSVAFLACANDDGTVPKNETGGAAGDVSGTSGTSGGGASGTGSGASGSSGVSGTSGSNGTAGATTGGSSGSSGASGSSGTGGTSATGGTSGGSGAAGSSGTGGTAGEAGTGGTSGTAGASAGSSGTGGTAGQSGSSGSSGTGGTSGMSGTAGTAPNPEDCLNGIDDNGDGHIDCDDPLCNPEARCVATDPPTGWQGPVALYDGAIGGEPQCPAKFPTQAYLGDRGITAPPADCSVCSCSAPAGKTCQLPTTFTIGDATCSGSTICTGILDDVPAGWTGTCYAQSGFSGGVNTCGANGGPTCTSGTSPCSVSVSSDPALAVGGSCTPSGGAPNLPSFSATLGKACGAPVTGGGCGTGQSCVARPVAPFASGVCVFQAGDVSCPGLPFTQKKVYYEGVNDTRSCSACACGSATDGTCPATVSLYSNTNGTCSTQIASFAAGGCADLTGNPAVIGRKATITGGPTGGSCPPSGGGPIGTIAADTATSTTFCCIP